MAVNKKLVKYLEKHLSDIDRATAVHVANGDVGRATSLNNYRETQATRLRVALEG